MSKANQLENTLTELFRSGADEYHDEIETEELLEGTDFSMLLQGLYFSRMNVYEYRADSKLENSFEYRGPELFSGAAMLLYTDMGDACVDVAFGAHRAKPVVYCPELSGDYHRENRLPEPLFHPDRGKGRGDPR